MGYSSRWAEMVEQMVMAGGRLLGRWYAVPAVALFLLASGGVTGCTGCPAKRFAFKDPADLLRTFIKSAQERSVYDVLGCLHPKIRHHTRRTLVAYIENREARDIALGHLRRRFRGRVRAEDYESLVDACVFSVYDEVDLRNLGEDVIDRGSPGVVHFRLDKGTVFPHRAELDMGSWWLSPAVVDSDYMLTLKGSRKLLELQTKYFRDLSEGIREGTIDETNIRERLMRVWY